MNLTFNSSVGNIEDDFPTNQPLHSLKIDVMARLKLDPDQAGQYLLACDGKTLDETRTVAELELPENPMLILWRTAGSPTGRARTWDRSQER